MPIELRHRDGRKHAQASRRTNRISIQVREHLLAPLETANEEEHDGDTRPLGPGSPAEPLRSPLVDADRR